MTAPVLTMGANEGAGLRQHRKNAGISLEVLAVALAQHEPTWTKYRLSQFELGRRSMPDTAYIAVFSTIERLRLAKQSDTSAALKEAIAAWNAVSPTSCTDRIRSASEELLRAWACLHDTERCRISTALAALSATDSETFNQWAMGPIVYLRHGMEVVERHGGRVCAAKGSLEGTGS